MMEIEYRGVFFQSENCGICRSGGPDSRWIISNGVFGGGGSIEEDVFSEEVVFSEEGRNSL